jgi:hypothetical protein
MADQLDVMGSSSIVYDVPNNKVRGYSWTELDYETAVYYTAYVCGSLYKDGIEQVRVCHSGFITASANTQFTGVTSSGSVTSDHYVDLQYFDEPNQSYIDYAGYSFLPGYTYPVDWLFIASNIFTYIQPVSIRLGSTTVDCRCACTRRLYETEYNGLKAACPKLNNCRVCRLGGPGTPDPSYNCLAWTVSGTGWHWFQADFNLNGLLSDGELDGYHVMHSIQAGTVYYYGPDATNIKHVAARKLGGGVDCLYTSKLGDGLLIAHEPYELEAPHPPAYGNIVGGN